MAVKKNIDLHVCATKMSDDLNKRYQTNTFNKIIHITNGLFNGDGGKLTLVFDTPLPPKGHIKKSERKIEQKISDFTGVVTLAYDLTIKKKNGSMEIIVAESNTSCIFTLHYNLYVPTNQQVIEVPPNASFKKVRDILCRNIPPLEAVEPGSHFKEFTFGTAVDFGESKTVQFKHLLEKRTKNISLAQRLIKNGKFLCYVSAFANHSAGHIYIGIDDNGIVQGEKITLRDETELKKEISKAVGNMIWPDNSHTQGGEEKRWQINFEAVKNSDGEIVPSTFVIVIYVAPCPGGVFTKQPEQYEINEENEAVKIDFPTWKKIIVEGLERDKGN
jgi:hypothetical protein